MPTLPQVIYPIIFAILVLTIAYVYTVRVPENSKLFICKRSRLWFVHAVLIASLAVTYNLLVSFDLFIYYDNFHKLWFLITIVWADFLFTIAMIVMGRPFLKITLTVRFEVLAHTIPTVLLLIAFFVLGAQSWLYQFTLFTFAAFFVLLQVHYYFIIKRAKADVEKKMENYYSDDSDKQIKSILYLSWVTIFVFIASIVFALVGNCWLILFGYFLFALLAFYFGITLVNFGIHFATIRKVFEPEKEFPEKNEVFKQIESKLQAWILEKGFTKQGVTIQLVAEYCGTNRTYLSSYINKLQQKNFSDWINAMRTEYACELFEKHPNYSMEAIGNMAGYADKSYFTKQFKKFSGASPIEYLQRYKCAQ